MLGSVVASTNEGDKYMNNASKEMGKAKYEAFPLSSQKGKKLQPAVLYPAHTDFTQSNVK